MRSEPSQTAISLGHDTPSGRRPAPHWQNVEEQSVSEVAAFGGQEAPYEAVFGDVSKIIDAARESAARSVNAAMTAAYWLIGHRIVEFEQSGEERAEYGAALIERSKECVSLKAVRADPINHYLQAISQVVDHRDSIHSDFHASDLVGLDRPTLFLTCQQGTYCELRKCTLGEEISKLNRSAGIADYNW